MQIDDDVIDFDAMSPDERKAHLKEIGAIPMSKLIVPPQELTPKDRAILSAIADANERERAEAAQLH